MILAAMNMSLLAASGDATPQIEDPAGILAILLAVLAAIFLTAQHPIFGRLFKIIPALLFCYFVPTTLTTFDVIPDASPLYDWIKTYILPASLLLLILALDVPGIIRLGPKAVTMLLVGTTGVVLGGPLALLITRTWLPDDIWRGMTALAGSWIGGGANMGALSDIAKTPPDMFGRMVIVDVFVANIWMGVLLLAAGRHRQIDAFTGADTTAIDDLERRMTDFQARTSRIPTLTDLIVILALGFGGCWLAHESGIRIHARASEWWPEVDKMFSESTWKYVLITTVGVLLSFTPVRRLEGAGASRIGSVMIYLLVASFGAKANFSDIGEHGALIAMGFIWMSVHVVVMLTVGWLIRAPIFFVAVGSQANIGGAASAPVVASAFHPSLASVGVLLAVAGYVLGTYAGIVCMWLLQYVSN